MDPRVRQYRSQRAVAAPGIPNSVRTAAAAASATTVTLNSTVVSGGELELIDQQERLIRAEKGIDPWAISTGNV